MIWLCKPITVAAWAGRGEASQAWHDLLAVQTSKIYDAYHTAITRILHTGHSSGSDAFLGFLIGTTTSY